MEPLPVRPVSMSMSMPSKLYFFRIGTIVSTKWSATAVELRSMPGRGAADGHQDRRARGYSAWHISAGVATFTFASMPSSHSAVPSGADDGEGGVDDVVAVLREFGVGDRGPAEGGWTPLAAPSQFSQ